MATGRPMAALVAAALVAGVLTGGLAMTARGQPQPAAKQGTNPLDRSTDAARLPKFAIVVHGGVNGGIAEPGTRPSCEMDQIASDEQAIVEGDLRSAIDRGYEILAAGGSATDAVVAAVVVLEDSPYFNAGRGSIETRDGTIEMDASVMIGPAQTVGAIAAVTTLKNPIKGALAILRGQEQVLMVGQGAEKRALEIDPALESMDPSYFKVQRACVSAPAGNAIPLHRTGTVGAVALDQHGNLAAASSTGGYPGKVSGRVGDSPIAGAGTYADKRVAISSSGIGEYFIRYNIGHTVASRMEYLGEPLDVAAQETFDSVYENEGLKNVDVAQCLRDRPLPDCQEIDKIVQRFHALGIGGVIALDTDGTLLEYFRFSAFARGYRRGSDASATVRL